MRRIYPKPPIVEAVVEFRFASETSHSKLLSAIEGSLRERYAGEPRQQDLVEVSAALAPDSLSASARRLRHVTFLQSNDGLRLVGCGDSLLSIHVLAPYPGWENFIEQVSEVVDAVPAEVRDSGVDVLGVRYIDRIILPKDAQNFSDYITIMPYRPEQLPPMLGFFHFASESRDSTDGTVAVMTFASGQPSDGAPVVIYDLTLRRPGKPAHVVADGSWLPIVEELHQRQRDIFEASITDKMRDLFQ